MLGILSKNSPWKKRTKNTCTGFSLTSPFRQSCWNFMIRKALHTRCRSIWNQGQSWGCWVQSYDHHAQTYVVRWGSGMQSIAEGVLNTAKTFHQMTSATSNETHREIQGPQDQKLFANIHTIPTIEDTGHPKAVWTVSLAERVFANCLLDMALCAALIWQTFLLPRHRSLWNA